MGTFKELLDYLAKFFTWWISIQPWEQGLRVRAGKYERLLYPGIHFKIPILDLVYVQTDRPRVVNIPIQTLTTKDGKTITVSTAFGYSISSILKLYHSLYQPELTISNMVMSSVAEYVATHPIDECTPSKIESNSIPDLVGKGIKDVKVTIVGYAIVKTYRIISEGSYMDPGFRLDKSSAAIV
jgi:hypothetical protein